VGKSVKIPHELNEIGRPGLPGNKVSSALSSSENWIWRYIQKNWPLHCWRHVKETRVLWWRRQ